jgi:hypothetical protein
MKRSVIKGKRSLSLARKKREAKDSDGCWKKASKVVEGLR